MKEESKSTIYENYKLADTSSVLKIRLNTDYILERVRIFLTGKIRDVVYKDGKPEEVEIEIAKKKANEEGIQNILNLVENIVNPGTVQGNFDKEMYASYIAESHQSLLDMVMENLYNWEISEDDIEPIIDTIMLLVIPYISRLINNLERESYSQTLKALEQSNVSQSKGLFK